MKVRACIRCGECCKASPCFFGEWDEENHQCLYLTPEPHEGYTLYLCSIYEKIIGHPLADINPAFGAGCCRGLFNESRERILKAQKVTKNVSQRL